VQIAAPVWLDHVNRWSGWRGRVWTGVPDGYIDGTKAGIFQGTSSFLPNVLELYGCWHCICIPQYLGLAYCAESSRRCWAAALLVRIKLARVGKGCPMLCA
jgi:hypothetical protein